MKLLPIVALIIGSWSPLPRADAADSKIVKDDPCAALANAPENLKKVYELEPMDSICFAAYWSVFHGKSAKQILKPGNFTSYQEKLERKDCGAALDLIKPAFQRAFPRAPNFLDNTYHFAQWNLSVVPKFFPGLAVCQALRDIKLARLQFKRSNRKVDRFKSPKESLFRFTSMDDPELKRNLAVQILLAMKWYDPAGFTLAKFSHKGEIVRLTPDYQYFRLRLIRTGKLKTAEYAEMLRAVRTRLSPEQIDDLDRQVKQRLFKRQGSVTE